MAKIQDIRHRTPGNSRRSLSRITTIVRHHSATAGGDFDSFWRHWNGKLGWGTGGYHEIILRDGTVQVCYPPEIITNGVGNNNSYTYHICLVGNGSFTEAQEEAWSERVAFNMDRLGIGVNNVKGHREMPGASTACPGINMDTVRNAIGNGTTVKGSTSPATLLRKGDSGADVRRLQNDLLKAGEKLPQYGVDGHYGEETVVAVEAFQARHGLTIDGIAGNETINKLGEVLEGLSETNGGFELFEPSNRSLRNDTLDMLKAWSNDELRNPLSKSYAEELEKGELSTSDAIAVIYSAIKRGDVI